MSKSRLSQPAHYAIHIKEQIPSRWSMWFEGLTITDLKDEGCILSGPVVDQSALHGLLAKIRDLNLTLISVIQIEDPEAEINLRYGIKPEDMRGHDEKSIGRRCHRLSGQICPPGIQTARLLGSSFDPQ